jgi:PAS domain S-box-containing protein
MTPPSDRQPILTEESLARERLFAQQVRDIVLFIRPDGRIVEANPAAVTAYGYDRDTLLTRTIFDLRDPATAHLIPAQMSQAGKQGITFETFHRRKDGSLFPVEVSSRGADIGGERLLLSIIRDISDRKRAEAALRDSEERFRELFENANDVIYTLDLSGRITSVNRRAEETFGYTSEECVGRSAAALVPAEYLPRMQEALRRKLAGEASPTTYELEVISKGGSRVPLEVSSRLIVRDGQPVGVQGIARNITERRRAEEALRLSEIRFRKLVEQSPLGIQVLAPDGMTRRVNRAWEDLFGVTLEQMANYNIFRDDRPIVRDILPYIHRAFAGESVAVPPSDYIPDRGRYQGQERWIRAFVYPVRDEENKLEEVVLIQEDITERMQAEAERERLVQEMQEADRRKDEFLAMLAHELRNPLTPIRNAIHMVKLVGGSHPDLVRMRDMIERQVAHLARLVDDLLDVSRITRGKILLRKEQFDLVPLVKAAVEDHWPMMEAGGLKLTVDLPDRALMVRGDPTRLTQVVGNLLHNAHKFTDAGGLVTVRLGLAPDGQQACLTVRDTGIGMEADILGRLFEPFSQADCSLDRSRGGLGLGLALVKGLTELHGGVVRATSPGHGQGAEFIITLPLCTLSPTPGETAPDRRPRGRSLRILLVEDNRDAAESLQLVLQYFGHEVTVAHTGAEGLAAARQLCPDVVVCDIGLPGALDGYAVARALRGDAEQSVATLIALSGYGQEEDQRKARQAGFDRHLTKPVDPDVLTELLTTLPRRPGR